jgi:hypothetical protein
MHCLQVQKTNRATGCKCMAESVAPARLNSTMNGLTFAVFPDAL